VNKAKITLFVLGWVCIPMSFLLWLVTLLWPDAPGISAADHVNETKGIALVITLGAIGGYIRWMHYLKVIVYDSEKFWQWMLDSVITPLLGAALALVTCIAVRAGLTVQGGSAGPGGVNWLGLYAIAGVTGLFSPDAIKRLEAAFQVFFVPHSKASDGGASSPASQPTSDTISGKE
jgi:hypothetical protein